MFKNTGTMCLLEVQDMNNEDGFRVVDVGNWFKCQQTNEKYVLMSVKNAKKYYEHPDVKGKIIVKKQESR